MTSTRYTVRRAELTSAEIRQGLIPGWEVIGRDANGTFSATVVDTRDAAREIARNLNAR